MSEYTRAKGARLLTEGRVHVLSADGRGIACRVHSDTGTWTTWIDQLGPGCDCPAKGRCSHQEAVCLIRERKPW